MAKSKTKQQLAFENDELQARLQELEETLHAIRSGAVDAIVTSGPMGDRVFTLEGADHAYHVMVESMNEGAVTLLMDGTILYGNRQFAQITKASPSAVVGRLFHEFVSDFDQPILNTLIDKEGRDCPKVEIRLRNGPGGDIPVQIAASPIELGSAKAMTLVITDLSTQKRYEEIVAEEKLSRRILEQAQEAIAVCIDGYIVRANKALYEICGSVPLMQPFDEIFSLQLSESETFSVAVPESEKTIQKQEVRYQRPDGKIFDLVLTAGPLVGQENKVLGTLISMMDITERKQAEDALRKVKDGLEERVKERTYELYVESLYARSLIEASLDPLVTISVDGKITDVNHASEEVTGVPREQLIGSDFSDYFTEAEKARAGYEEVFKQGFVRDYPLELNHRNGQVTPVLYNASVYRDETGRSMGVFAAARDITERRQAEAALRKLASELVLAEERERKKIAVTLHDEIAQTLAAAKMRLDLLKTMKGSIESRHVVEEAGELLVRSIRETRSLMNDISNPVLYDMGLPAAVQNLAEQASARYGLTVSHSVSGQFGNLELELNVMVFQALRELVQNVVKHSQAQNVSVRVVAEETGVRTIVADDGRGFDVCKIGSPGHEGGFGLFSIRERVKSFNGELRIESAPGKGTEVTIVLPAVLRNENVAQGVEKAF